MAFARARLIRALGAWMNLIKLLNFELESSYYALTIKGLGYDWDLHNFADYQGFCFDPTDNSLSLMWIAVPNEGNPWGCPANKSKGCKLIFRNIRFLQMSGMDESIPLSEELGLSSISKVIPNTTEWRCKETWDETDEFNLLFEFQSERSLEIGAESVEL
jgi:hypothetical protein